MRTGQLRASSLLEVLISLALFSLILGLTALLLTSYQKLVRQGRARLSLVLSASSALKDIGAECARAIRLDETGARLRLHRLQDEPAGRLPAAYPSPLPMLTPPVPLRHSSHQIEVTYRRDGDGSLWRETAGQRQQILPSTSDFQATPQADGTLALSLELMVEQRAERLRLEVYSPLP